MAERGGFEPPYPIMGKRFSRPSRSTTPAPLRNTVCSFVSLEFVKEQKNSKIKSKTLIARGKFFIQLFEFLHFGFEQLKKEKSYRHKQSKVLPSSA